MKLQELSMCKVVPEDLEDRQEEIEARFVELHRQDIIDELTKNATFA